MTKKPEIVILSVKSRSYCFTCIKQVCRAPVHGVTRMTDHINTEVFAWDKL